MLKITNLNFGYEESSNIFTNFSFSVGKGEFVCLEGINGAGKTTLLNILSGLNYSPDIVIQLSDQTITQEELKKEIIYIPTKPEFYDELTVDEYVKLVSFLWNLPKEFKQLVYRNLKRIDLTQTNYQKIGMLSLGMQYKLYLSVFLAIPRRILLLDEPFNALDIESRKTAITMVKEYVGKNDGLCLFSSHVNETINHLRSRTISLS